MNTVKVKGYAKVNLFLDIVGACGGYHMLDSVVTTIDLFDQITIKKRKDKNIIVENAHSLYAVSGEVCDNNAYKAAKLFMDTFNTSGVSITIQKNIPIGSGLGGSSADISAVLNGMQKLFAITADLKPLADSLGSDSGYLLCGGFCRMQGRGERLSFFNSAQTLNFVIVTADGGVNTSQCFAVYDSTPSLPVELGAERLITALCGGVLQNDMFYNALFKPASTLNKNVLCAFNDLADLNPVAVCMSGSGSSVFAIFQTQELCQWAKTKLDKKYKNIFVTKSVNPSKPKKFGFFERSIYS